MRRRQETIGSDLGRHLAAKAKRGDPQRPPPATEELRHGTAPKAFGPAVRTVPIGRGRGGASRPGPEGPSAEGTEGEAGMDEANGGAVPQDAGGLSQVPRGDPWGTPR